MELHALIEAILFWKGEPQSFVELARMTGRSEEDVRFSFGALEASLAGRGIRLVYKDDHAMLATSPDASAIIEVLIKEELSKDLGKAGLETLSIVLYMGPVSRADIDYVRGVNSTFILRNLLVRGLVEKISHPGDSRSFLYRPSFELLSYLGVSRVEDIPAYEETRTAIAAFHAEKGTTEKKLEHEGVETNTDMSNEDDSAENTEHGRA